DPDLPSFLERVEPNRPLLHDALVVFVGPGSSHVLVEDRENLSALDHAGNDRRVMGILLVPGDPSALRHIPLSLEDRVTELRDVAGESTGERSDGLTPNEITPSVEWESPGTCRLKSRACQVRALPAVHFLTDLAASELQDFGIERWQRRLGGFRGRPEDQHG